jgi:uncharacterized membrane protein YfcA
MSDSPLVVVAVLSVVFLAAFTRSALGFGDALIAMPLLALMVGMQTATPLVALASSTIAATILMGAWRRVELKVVWRLILSTLVGIPIGLFFLKVAPEGVVKAMLGVVLVAFGLYSLVRPNLPTLGSEKLSYVFGFVAGILGGAYNTNGPPVVIYGALRDWSPESFRATLQGYFFPTGAMILVSHGLAGLWTPRVLRLYIYALPVIVTAALLGGRVNRMISSGQFNRIVYGFLVLVGVLLFV